MDTHGTLVTVGPCILKIHHQLVKIGCWSNASLALTWHSAPHKCAKFRSSRYSTPPRVTRVLEQSNCLKTSLPGMASLTVNLNDAKATSSQIRGKCSQLLQSFVKPLDTNLAQKKIKKDQKGVDGMQDHLKLIFQSPTVQQCNRSQSTKRKQSCCRPCCIYMYATGCDTPVPVK